MVWAKAMMLGTGGLSQRLWVPFFLDFGLAGRSNRDFALEWNGCLIGHCRFAAQPLPDWVVDCGSCCF